MSADHHPTTIAAENGAARDANHLESSGDLNAVLMGNDAPSGRLPDATSVPAAGDVDTIENGEVDEGGTTGDGASRPTPSSPDTVSDERSEPDRFDDPFRMYIREIGRVE